MSVFAKNEWTGNVLTFGIVLAVVVGQIHFTVNVCSTLLQGTLIVYGTRGVKGFDHVVCLFHIYAIASLIAKTPANDAGVVFKNVSVVAVAF